MRIWIAIAVVAVSFLAEAHAAEVAPLVKTLRAVGGDGAGHREATKAWAALAQVDAAKLPEILAGLDGANPLAANWLRAAVETIAERQLQRGQKLPTAELERFVLDRSHEPRPRRLAYEWLLRADPAAKGRLIPKMLDDPSTELRRDAVAEVFDEGTKAEAAGNKADAIARYRQVLESGRDLDQVRNVAGRLRKLGEKVDLAGQLGFVVRWKLLGPFDNSGEKGLDAAYPPEKELRFDAPCPGKRGPVRWIDFASDDDLGKVDFNKALGEEKSVVGYAAAEFTASGERKAELRMMSDNAVAVWVNGEQVGRFKSYHAGSQPDQYVCPVTLRPGKNAILVKVCQNDMPQDWAKSWDFALRIVDATGAAVRPEPSRPAH
jgi:hypothetical protein